MTSAWTRSGIAALLCVIVTWGCASGPTPGQATPPTPEVEKVVDGLGLTEGPIWHRDGYLLFVDVTASRIHRWSPQSGLAVVRDSTGRANGIAIDAAGDLIVAQRDRRLSRIARNGAIVLLAERYQGKRLNSPNDLVIRSDGSVYFTDPTFGVRPDAAELGFRGVFRLGVDGSLHLLASDFTMPNGIAFAPDEKRLYVNDSAEGHMRVFDVAPDGSLTNGRVFATLKDTTHEGDPDGLDTDGAGNVYSAGPGGVWVFAPNGALRYRIAIPEEHTTNLAWGDADGRTLYVTAVSRIPGGFSGKVYRVRSADFASRGRQ